MASTFWLSQIHKPLKFEHQMEREGAMIPKGNAGKSTAKNGRILHICTFVGRELGDEELNRLLRRVGVEPGTQSEADFSPQQEATFLREASRAAGDITFAARAGLAFRQANTLTAYIARSSATLRQAIVNGTRAYGLTDTSTEFRLMTKNGHDTLKIVTPDGALLRHHRFQEFRLFGMLARLRAIAGVEFHPDHLCLQHEFGGDQRVFEKLAGCPIQTQSSYSGLQFKPGALDLPLRTHDPELVSYLSDLADTQMKQAGLRRQSVRAKVEALLIAKLPGRILTADEVAADLGMSRRTLTRHLKPENLTFRDIVESLRYDLAKTYLRDGLSISEIAFYLGYGDHAAFSTAFRRWSGQSPRAYQKDI
ncbi:AraC family transcriptional regulator (plasmid) [Rhodobacteraceae bacterium M382]|nr:AraC family transcriptional regulator [Rhodobacteraceae bacterium M382]